MSKNIEAARELLNRLKKERDGYPRKVIGRITKLYTGNNDNKRPKPDTFKESSFMYIRSYNNDTGVRPFSGISFWNSPDINISPINNLGVYTTTLEGGISYNIACRLHNRGDLMIPYPKVEFFLASPTLGFNTTVAQYLGVTQLPALLLPASNMEANFVYNVPPAESGHKCLFARAWSFSPLDKPFDLFALDPRTDRHIAQKNLNFVPQATPYMFNVVHQPNALETIVFRPLSKDAALNLQHPAFRDWKIMNITRPEILNRIKVEIVGKPATKVTLENANGTLQMRSSGKGLNLDRQAAIFKETEAIIHSVNAGRSSFSDHKKALGIYKDMNRNVAITSMQIVIPKFGLKPGYAAAFDIVNINQLNGQIKGGITIVAMG
ncbi:hypothetical protein TBC1_111812 [Lentimicrobium saccharophilum]|uniref:Uncharacterized protein n=1 Tax=Lentimicrobium saccharophilum TaxID=1678841 RepID=A0A0S7C3L8_9BACT|nr:hypothetical protein [Lentimicrobium saccharophilum]GAP43656.1 hypothetical protein TBC1_111812 [Lentimicrobium saccharophilum]